MSNQVFPTLQTKSWKMSRVPQWKTQVQTGTDGDRKRAPLQERPFWRWTLKNGVLQSALGDLQAIQDLYLAMYGRLDYFLWNDPEGDSIVDPTVQIAIGNTYFWPVAFTEDSIDFDRFAYQLWECGEVSFEQVLLPSAAGGSGGGSGGSSNVSASLSVTTEFINTTGAIAIAHAFMGETELFESTVPYGQRTDSLGLVDASQLSGLTVSFFVDNPIGLSHGGGWSASLLIYDVYVDVLYEDGTTGRVRPHSAVLSSGNPGFGAITNAGNAIDGDPSTAATLTRTAYDVLDFFNTFTLSNFF